MSQKVSIGWYRAFVADTTNDTHSGIGIDASLQDANQSCKQTTGLWAI